MDHKAFFVAACLAAGFSPVAMAASPLADDVEADASASTSASDDNVQAESSTGAKIDSMQDSAAQTVSDATITAKVKSKLLAEKATQGLKINVDTKDGAVTLSGDVRSTAEKDMAEKLAKETEGVKSVDNKLTVGMKK